MANNFNDKKRLKTYIVKLCLDFVEGKILLNKFISLLRNDSCFKDFYDINKKFKFYMYPLEQVYNIDFDSTTSIIMTYNRIMNFLYDGKISFNTDKNDEYNNAIMYTNILPSYIYIPSINEIHKYVFDILEQNISRDKKIILGKKRFKSIFKYKTRPPRWVQVPAWPIVNDIPLLFLYQKDDPDDFDKVNYYFYNQETQEKVVFSDFY
jgi:hypothetical protein